MSATRADMGRSIEATQAALDKLSAPQLDLVRVQTSDALEDFIRNEWIPLNPIERARRAAAEAFHASVRVHDLNQWRAA